TASPSSLARTARRGTWAATGSSSRPPTRTTAPATSPPRASTTRTRRRAPARRRRPATVRLATLRLAGVARNRSFDAFALDPERDALLAENAALPVAPAPGWDAD